MNDATKELIRTIMDDKRLGVSIRDAINYVKTYDIEDYISPKHLAIIEYLVEEEDVDVFDAVEVCSSLDNDSVIERAEVGLQYEITVYEPQEAQDALYEYLGQLFDELIYDCPEHWKRYINRDRWISDAAYDGRAHSLSSYDGSEWEFNYHYIYRN